MSRVTCHMSHVTRHMSHVTCHTYPVTRAGSHDLDHITQINQLTPTQSLGQGHVTLGALDKPGQNSNPLGGLENL